MRMRINVVLRTGPKFIAGMYRYSLEKLLTGIALDRDMQFIFWSVDKKAPEKVAELWTY